jgi:uncharacterized protein YjbI with pentapeptide repeats
MAMPEAITALTAIGALVFTGLSLNATRDQVAAAQQQNEVAEQGQYTDRYIKAVEQLDQVGPDHLQSRLGAIYALERLARDSSRDQPTIIETLAAFIRTSRPTSTPSELLLICPPPQPLASDTQAAFAVLARRDHTYDNNTRIDLTNTCLNGISLDGADLSSANLIGANLIGTGMFGANLRDADLSMADLSNANLSYINLQRADLSGANLSSANLQYADLSNANLSDLGMRDITLGHPLIFPSRPGGANLTDADLSYANLRSTSLNNANLSGADLVAVNLRTADLLGTNLSSADLSGADLRGASHDTQTIIDNVATNPSTIGRWW